ncbi:MAG: hypothetical protein AAF449_05070, partial [Myxococcota bacterium]
DAAAFSLPVYSPAATETFAAYGNLTDDGIRVPFDRPEGIVDTFGGLEITTASTQLQALTDAFLYHQKYPYECSEQLASRVISVVALRDVLSAFKAKDMPSTEKIDAVLRQDIVELGRRQTPQGGWGFWTSMGRAWPFIGVHVMHALVRAQSKDIQVPKEVMDLGRDYLKDIKEYFPKGYPKPIRHSTEAYALYVRAMMGDLDARRALALIREAGGMQKMPLEMAGWLYPVLVDGRDTRRAVAQLRRRMSNEVTETAGEAHFVTEYSDGAHLLLHSNRRTDALLLEGLLRDRPRDSLVPKLVRGLLAGRAQGRWGSTQENVWVLLALERYFKTYERVTPNFVARLWLGERFVGEQAYEGRVIQNHRWFVPMNQLKDAPDVLLQRTGAGRLYYRLGLTYAPNDRQQALDRGFTVSRYYEAVEDDGDVRQDADGTWRVRAGALVRVQLKMVVPGRRHHVALTDRLPAGFEPLNPALAVSEDIGPPPEAEGGPWWWTRPWFDHQNLKDERVEAFGASLGAGIYSYSYVARATTPGRFRIPAAHAEQMYAPETFGRSRAERVIVE